MNDCPYIVLHKRWKPKKRRASYIGPRLLDFTRARNLVPLADPVHGPQITSMWCSVEDHAEVRRNTPQTGQGEGWHQDGDLKPGSRMDHAAVLWASSEPTQFKVGSKVFQPRPYEVILVRNLGCLHRRPPDARPKRWVFRQRVEIPSHYSLP